ncbi:hypothetical protein [Thermoactinomyces sp. DSM 45892]|uniref:hypothetical protein n=1 Tax=Thermoactinomyces sp. DSM 45892 TaxID=1882753 RepID=UPI0015A2768B|nr:hypothetical protein [Thermoactinomyces sp. DSM 45892]
MSNLKVLTHNKCEIEVDASDYNNARNKALELTQQYMGNSRSYTGRLEKSYGNGKTVGRQSENGRTRWRVDWDEGKGPHINVEIMENKGSKEKFAVKFPGSVNKIIDRFNR